MNRAYRTNIFVLIMMITQLVLSFFWYYIVSFFSLGFVSQMILTQILIFILPAILFIAIMQEPVKEVLSIRPLGWKNVLLILVISIFIQPIMSLLSVLSSILFPNEISNIMSEVSYTPTILLILAMAVTPAICEEIFFRGLVFSGFKNLNIKKASIMTGFLFGLMHLDGQQFLYAFAMGVVFCYLVYKTKSIFASILAHFTINASQVLLSQITYYFYEMADVEISSALPTIQDYIYTITAVCVLIVFTLPILILAFWFFHRINKPVKIEETQVVSVDIFDYCPMEKYEEKAFNLPLVLILILYFLVVILIPVFMKTQSI